MEASFWHQKWERGEIGFHENEINSFLIKHFEALNPPKGSRIFLPLCGKTRDIGWFLANGYRVIGAELSELAIHELFTELGITPEISKDGRLTCYRAENLDILAGDFFRCIRRISWTHQRDIRSSSFSRAARPHAQAIFLAPDASNRCGTAIADHL